MSDDRFNEEDPEDILAKAMANIVIEHKRAWKKETEIMAAESRAIIAELKLAVGAGELVDLKRRVDNLDDRVAGVEQRGIKFCGTFQRALDYARGSLVVHSGSLWAAVKDTAAGEEPGNCQAWQLAAKGQQK